MFTDVHSTNICPSIFLRSGYLGGHWGTQFKSGAEGALRSLTSILLPQEVQLYPSPVTSCKRLTACYLFNGRWRQQRQLETTRGPTYSLARLEHHASLVATLTNTETAHGPTAMASDVPETHSDVHGFMLFLWSTMLIVRSHSDDSHVNATAPSMCRSWTRMHFTLVLILCSPCMVNEH